MEHPFSLAYRLAFVMHINIYIYSTCVYIYKDSTLLPPFLLQCKTRLVNVKRSINMHLQNLRPMARAPPMPPRHTEVGMSQVPGVALGPATPGDSQATTPPLLPYFRFLYRRR